MARTVTHRDRLYTEDEAVMISTLRAERWGLMHMIEELQHVKGDAPKAKSDKAWRRIAVINKNLYRLTKNPIYIS